MPSGRQMSYSSISRPLGVGAAAPPCCLLGAAPLVNLCAGSKKDVRWIAADLSEMGYSRHKGAHFCRTRTLKKT